MNLRFCYNSAIDAGEEGHAAEVMDQIGIKYQHATPQSIGDQWWFWNCTNIPENLPIYITELDVDPMKAIGWGLSQEKAEELSRDTTSD